MFGTYQKSNLRIELNATAKAIGESLILPHNLKQWVWPQQIQSSSAQLSKGDIFSSRLTPDILSPIAGFAQVNHQVEQVSANGLRLLLSGGIDGFHEWQWGEGWVQSRLEGISLLPLGLGQTLSLARLKAHVSKRT